MSRSRPPAVHVIKIKLRELGQLFNSIDPSPFNERDLDHDAEEFIISWALEAPADADIKLVVHLAQPPPATAAQVAESVQHYFRYRADITRNELRELFREGRSSLAVGLIFLAVCMVASQAVLGLGEGSWQSIVHEGLIITGWVAMWRPMQVYLYDWWPMHRRRRTYDKLGRISVELVAPGA
ncbi:MAG TPA: hypothetical protein VFB27_12495 [Opitutaceae bacterium]|nr:hypothetical protein [Opitutaceae bacterium]